MNVWFAKAAVILATVVMIVVRAPHGQRSRTVKVATDRKGPLETGLLTIAWLAFLIPIVWLATPWLSFADYPLDPVSFAAGVIGYVLSLWWFHRSHADLGTNWSITLQVRESHQLVTNGIYRRIRHPMYMALLLYGLAQMLVLPNWIAGPSYLVAMGLLFALRVGPEERMMADRFGAEYEAYRARTKRLVPGIW